VQALDCMQEVEFTYGAWYLLVFVWSRTFGVKEREGSQERRLGRRDAVYWQHAIRCGLGLWLYSSCSM
jgi:hypothetical protein